MAEGRGGAWRAGSFLGSRHGDQHSPGEGAEPDTPDPVTLGRGLFPARLPLSGGKLRPRIY